MTGEAGATWPEGMATSMAAARPGSAAPTIPSSSLAYFGTGNPAPWNSHLRPGDNLYTASTIAVDVESGEIKWHYQTTPHDGWDYDGVNELVAFDMEKDGETIKAGGKADRNGFFYVINRETGDFISGTPFVNQITWAEGDRRGWPSRSTWKKTTPKTRPRSRKAAWSGTRCSPPPPSSAARTGCRSPTAGTPSCSTCPPTNGAWTSGTSRSPTRRGRPIWAPASTSSR